MVSTLNNVISVEFLYLDLSHCGRCSGTSDVLTSALRTATPVLEALGYSVELKSIHVLSAEQAKELCFIASPTIRINGRDIQPEAYQSSCKECGELCNCAEGVDCRVWEWNGERTLTPQVGMIVGLLVDVARQPGRTHTTQTPHGHTVTSAQNIEKFFGGSEARQCCPTDCCG